MTLEDDSDASLSIWADWLEDNYQPILAEFVRSSLAQAPQPIWEYEYYGSVIGGVGVGGLDGGVGGGVGGGGGGGGGVGVDNGGVGGDII